jgi:two-component system, chemotaxis family, chemotaxis protein CheV
MSNILDAVDQRTRLVGRNRLELLTFRLNGQQLYAINVFKVQEVMSLPAMNALPHSDPVVVGVVHVRGRTLPVIDLSLAIGNRAIKDRDNASIIITEYNRRVQAFLVQKVDRIVNLNWEEILPPPGSAGRDHYLTAVTRLDERIVEIIDVEKVLARLVTFTTTISNEVLDSQLIETARTMEVLLVDDSPVAVAQVRGIFEQLQLKVTVESNGLKALQLLKRWAGEGIDVTEKLLMVVTDAEMPEMDGYRLTTEIRSDPRLRDLYVVLHTSLSGNFNRAMVKQVGCDEFLSKFQPNELAQVVQNRIRMRLQPAP